MVTGAGLTIYTVGGTAKCLDNRGCGYATVTLGPAADAVSVRFEPLTGPGLALCCGDFDSPIGATAVRPPLITCIGADSAPKLEKFRAGSWC